MKGVTKTIKNETKEQKGGFLGMLIGTLGASLLGNLLSGKGNVRPGEGIERVGYGSSIKKALIPPHPLTNFEIKEYYKNEPRFNGVYCRDNFPKTIKYGAHVISIDEYADVGTYWINLYVKSNELSYFDSFGVEKSTNLLGIKTQKQTYLEYKKKIQKCIGFIDFMFVNKTLIDFSSFFFHYDFKKTVNIILS